MTLTTILQIFKRPNYLKEQLLAIQNQTVKSDKIIIVHNEGNIDVDFDIPKNVQLVYSNPNMFFHLRFAVGLLVNTDYLFFFDDDTIPGIRFFETALEIINKNNCIVVGNGRIIHQLEQKWECPGWGNPSDQTKECDFGGHCWGMKKEHLKYMWYEEPIRLNNCEDMMLSFNCFRFGAIRTFVTQHPLFDKTKWSSLKGNELGSDSVASWIVNPSHFSDRWDTINEYIEKGYVPLIKRHV